jgi:hypothetical protein
MLPALSVVMPLADSIRAGGLDPARAVAEARSAGRTDDAVAAVIAAAIAEKPVDVEVAAPLVHEVGDPLEIPVLVASTSGDRAGALLSLVESDSMTSDREAMALLLASRIGFGRKTKQLARFRTLLRLVARRCSGGDDASLLIAAGRAASDPDVARVLASIASKADAEGAAFAKDVLEAFERPRDHLPKQAERWVATGFTAARAAPKVGRNDPCPCGSGKKYKKCCEGKPIAAPASSASPASAPDGAASSPYARVREPITPERVRTMPIQDLVAIEPKDLPGETLLPALRQLSLYRKWDEAERVLEVIEASASDADADRAREELILTALDVKQVDVAKRLREKMRSDLDPVTELRFELLAPTKHTLAHVDAVARESLKGDPTIAIDMAFGLLVTHPALGIYAARGAIDPKHPLDSELLLDAIEEARDRLALPPGDAWQTLYDEALDRDVEQHAAEAQADARDAALVKEADALREKAKHASAKVAELEARMREQERALREASAHKVETKTGATEEERRLRAKIDEYKARIAEGNEERASLRKELARANEELASAAAAPPARGPASEEQEAPTREEEGEAAAAPRELLLPRFARAAESTLRGMPMRTAREAMDTIVALASAEPLAWSEVKRLVRIVSRTIYEGRIGIHYRVLFAIDGKALDVLDVVHRKDLRAAVDRFA